MGNWLGKILARQTTAPPGWFASTTGSPSGAGTYADPWDLQTAMFGGPDYTVAGGNLTVPGSYVQPGDTVWIRGGTYTHAFQAGFQGNFGLQLEGTAANPITFRAYPGERVTIDGNYDPAVAGYAKAVIGSMGYFGTRGYTIIRDLEITNSRVGRACGPALLDLRSDGVFLMAPHGKVINCIIHDNGEGGEATAPAPGWEINGNLIYYNGGYGPFAEQNEAVSVDLVPAGGTAVATSGTYHKQETGATSITITNHVNAGDYTLVCAAKNGLDYTTMSATFDGAAMTLLVGRDGYSKSVAMFGIKGHTVTANVVVNSGDANVVRAIAQSFVNVNQNATETLNAVPGTFTVADGAMNSGSHTLTSTTGGFTADHVGQAIDVAGAGLAGATLTTCVATYTDPNTLELTDTSSANVSGKAVTIHGGTWWNDQWNDGCDTTQASTRHYNSALGAYTPPAAIDYSVTTPSNTNHMVVDGIAIYDAYSKNVAPSGDNAGNMIGGATPTNFGGNPIVRMSTATRTGAGTVNMGWAWTMLMYGHGHGWYIQAGASDSVIAVSGDQTLLWTGYAVPVNGPFRIYDVGATIRVTGAGTAGADLVTTIASYTNNSTVELTDAPSTSVNPTDAAWNSPAKFKDNIVLDQLVESIQAYGSSGAAATQLTLEGNFHYNNRVMLGGRSGFRMTDSVYKNNYTWSNTTNIGNEMNDMTNFRFEDNYVTDTTTIPVAPGTWNNMSLTGNTFIGAISGFSSTDFPTNDYSYVGANPTVNVIAVRPNDYEENRCNIYVYNWENLTSVDVDISSAVAVGTPINIMNAQNYFATPVYSGVYGGGTVNLPMTAAAITAAAAIGGPGGETDATYVPVGTMAPACAVFIVRAQSTETWR